jgi:hypothetical protein
MPNRPIRRLAAIVLAVAFAAPAPAQQRHPVAAGLPGEACLSAPTPACLAEALERAVASLERAEFRDQVGARYAFRPASTVVAEPALDALLLRLDRTLTQERLLALRDEWRRRLAAAPAPTPEVAPTPAEIAALRAKALAIRDAGDRSRAMIALLQKLARHERFDAIAPSMQAVMATLTGKSRDDRRLRGFVAATAARLLRQGRLWPEWSAALVSGGFDQAVARATPDSGPEEDPTDTVFDRFLDDGIPSEWLLRWALKAQNTAYREQIMLKIVESAARAGRREAWLGEFASLRQRVIAATANAEEINQQMAATSAAEMLALAGDEARKRGDHGLALAVKLQETLKPGYDASPAGRDHDRGFVLQAITQTMTALASDRKP